MEIAPDQFGKKLLATGLGVWMLIHQRQRSVPCLSWADLSKAEVRREFGGSFDIRPVTITSIVLNSFIEEMI